MSDGARRLELVFGEAGDGLLALDEVPPERLDVARAGKSPGQRDDRDPGFGVVGVGVGHRLPLPAERLVMRDSASFCFCARSARSRFFASPDLAAAGNAPAIARSGTGRARRPGDRADLHPQALVRLEEQERVAAEIEEVVVEADPFDLEELAPDRRDRLLELGARRRVRRAVRSRRGAAIVAARPRVSAGRRERIDRTVASGAAPIAVRTVVRSASSPSARLRVNRVGW